MRKIGFGSTKKIGFDIDGAVSKLVADFTTGEYKASGVTKTLAEVFTFSRAGKAWLVEESGLVEYAVDAPRFDNGLLIEQSATNKSVNSNFPANGTYAKRGVVYNAQGRWVYDGVETASVYLYQLPFPDLGAVGHIFSALSGVATINNIRTGTDTKPTVLHSSKGIFKRSFTYNSVGVASSTSGVVLDNVSNGSYPVHYQVEILNNQMLPTSPIVTTTAPVTRPADFIQSKVSGTTITGDWDSTLTLSISNGQIVHSGYGRIRSLEIN